MDAIQKELERSTKKAIPLVSTSSKASLTTVNESLDQLIKKLESAQQRLAPSSTGGDKASTSSTLPPPPIAPLCKDLAAACEATAKTIAEKQAVYETQLGNLGRAIDRKFPTAISTAAVANPSLFSSRNAQCALRHVVLDHLLRHGDWETAELFAKEMEVKLSKDRVSTFKRLHSTLEAIERGDLSSAIQWAQSERDFLGVRGSSLEFALHRSQFLQIATTGCRPIEPEGDEFDYDQTVQAASRTPLATSIPLKEADGDTPMMSGEDAEDEEEAEAAVGGRPSTSSSHGLALGASMMSCDTASFPGSMPPSFLTNKKLAFAYARRHFKPFLHSQILEVQRLYCLLMFLPEFPAAAPSPSSTRSADQTPIPSPSAPPLHHFYQRFPPLYHPLLDARLVHAPALLPLFRLDYCARMGVARDPPLKIAVEIGAGGALSRIMKVRQVMKLKGNEWSQADELPVSLCQNSHIVS